MICYKWLRPCGSTASAALMFLFSSACLVSGIGAQSAASAMAGSSLRSAAPSPFLVAPSIPLGYAPSSVATGDLRRTGKLDLVTADYDSGKITVFLGAGQGNFALESAYDAGPHPSQVVMADVNGDGRPDLLVPNESEGTISVLFGNGDGTLQPRKSYAIGFNPSFIAVGNFGGNGKVDVAVAGKSGNLLAILLNDGNGNLKKPVVFSLHKAPTALTVADFRNDGHSDLALANADGTVSIMLGQGAGLFHSLPDINVTSGSLSSIISGDFNKDGRTDFVVTEPGKMAVSVVFGKGDGTFAPPSRYSVGNTPVSTVLADVDGDGVADLVVINQASNTFSVLGGNGDGTFKSSVDFVAGNAPLAAVAGDFYGNGHVDLAIINHTSQSVSLPLGNGDGTFKTGRSYSAGQNPASIASGDLNGSKTHGLVVANYCGSDASCSKGGNVAVFLADDTGAYRISATYSIGVGPISVSLADVNADGKLDVIALNRLDKTVSVLPGMGDGTFAEQITFALANSPIAVAVGDFNKDGKPDLAVLEDCGAAKCSQPGSVEIMLGSGDGNFRSASTYTVGYSPVAVAIGATKLGGNADLLIANRCGLDASCQSGGTATVLFGDGKGLFKSGTDVALGNSPSSIALANLRGTGVLDLVVSRGADNAVAILPGTGNGTFKAAIPYAVGNSPASLVVADFNGDGQPDVAVANSGDSTVSVLFGRSDGTLQPAFSLPVAGNPAGLTAIGPTTSAGRASLATANGNPSSLVSGSNITVLPNIRPTPFGITANTTTLTVNPATTTVNSATPVVMTAVVTDAGGPPIPSGAIAFTGNGTPASFCPASTLNSAGTFSCSTNALQVNTTTLTASYAGDGTYAASNGTASVTVNALSANLGLSALPANSTVVGTPVTFTATLSGAVFTPVTPSGTVTFTINGSPNTDCPPATVHLAGAAWVATCTTNSLVAPADVIGASYGGDPNFTVAAPAALTQTVGKVAAHTLLASLPATSVVNQDVTFTATVSLATGGAASPVFPTGSVTFMQGATTLCSAVTLSGNPGKASCIHPFAAASPGTAITAVYSGDSNFTAGAPGTVTEIVTAAGTTTTLSSTPNPSSVNQQVAFTAIIAPAFAGATKPAGKVVFADSSTGGATLCTQTVAADGTVPVCLHTFASAGTNNIVATFTSSDSNFSNSGSSTDVQTVGAGSTAIVLTSAPGTSTVNELVTFTAVISANSGTTAPQGTVVYSEGPTTLCSVNLAPNGAVPNCTVPLSPAGTHSITAAFTSANGNFKSGTSNVLSQFVTPTSTATTVVGTPSTSVVNQTVTFVATVTTPAIPPYAGPTPEPLASPTGTVLFSYSQGAQTGILCAAAKPLSTAGSVTSATCAAPLPATGAYSITATYSGDSNFVKGASAQVNQTVNAASTSVAVTSSVGSPVVNQPVNFTAVITPAFAGTTVPTGTVVFTDTLTNKILCTITVAGGVVAPCGAALPTAATHTITAAYTTGDSNFLSSTSGTFSQTVQKATPMASVISSLPVSVATQSVTFTATFTPPFPGTAPSGAVTFSLVGDNVDSCVAVPASLPVNGLPPYAATCTIAFSSTVGGDVIVTASYAGDSNFTAASGGFTQKVQNFAVAFSAPASGASIVSQGYSSATDPFSPAPITMALTTFGGLSATLNATCTVINRSTNQAVSDPSCSPSPATVAASNGSSLAYTVTASGTAPVGSYSVAVTAVDSTTQTLSHSTPPLTIYVIGVTSPLSLAQGGTGIANAIFNTVTLPGAATAPTSLQSFACGTVLNAATGTPIASGQLTCTPVSSGAVTVPAGAQSVTVPITITASNTKIAQMQLFSTIYAAAFLGVPFLALVGWFGSRKSQRKNFFRFLGLVVAIVALSYVTGCGGSFTRPIVPPTTGGIQPGNYLVQVVATDQTGTNKYYAIVPLTVNSK